jgi:hypothetical protein
MDEKCFEYSCAQDETMFMLLYCNKYGLRKQTVWTCMHCSLPNEIYIYSDFMNR